MPQLVADFAAALVPIRSLPGAPITIGVEVPEGYETGDWSAEVWRSVNDSVRGTPVASASIGAFAAQTTELHWTAATVADLIPEGSWRFGGWWILSRDDGDGPRPWAKGPFVINPTADPAPAGSTQTLVFVAHDDTITVETGAVNAVEVAAARADSVYPPLRAGQWYRWPGSSTVGTTAGIPNGDLLLTPVWVPAAVSLDQLGAAVATAGDAGSKVRLGIWTDNLVTHTPNDLVLDAGTINGAATGWQALSVDLDLTRGWYWVGAAVQEVTSTSPVLRTTDRPAWSQHLPVTPGATGTGTNVGYLVADVTGAFGSLVGATLADTPIGVATGARTAP